MLRSLFTGVAGLRAHQQMLDVTSDNIANVNTAGFKASSAVFQTTLSQTLQAAGGPGGANSGAGGTNPMQVGLGVQLAGTELDLTQGQTQFTGRNSDLTIAGDGFFLVNDHGQQMLTRAGSFSLDAAGHLVTPNGSVLQSTNGGDLNLSALQSGNYTSWGVAADGKVNATDAAGKSVTLDTIQLATVANPAGLQRMNGTSFAISANSGPLTLGTAGSAGFGNLTSGYVEASNVDLSQQLTNLIIAERGFQANSRVISTSDEILQTLVNLKQ